MTPGEDTWIIYSGASKNMTGQKDTPSNLIEKEFPKKVSLGYDYQYSIKGMGESTYKLDSGTPMRMKDVLYVPGLKNNLLSISAMLSPILGITKEIMSRGSQVLDMEY